MRDSIFSSVFFSVEIGRKITLQEHSRQRLIFHGMMNQRRVLMKEWICWVLVLLLVTPTAAGMSYIALTRSVVSGLTNIHHADILIGFLPSK